MVNKYNNFKSWQTTTVEPHKAATLGVPASDRLIGVRQKLAKSLVETSLYFETSTQWEHQRITGSQSVVTFYLALFFPSSYSWNEAKLSVSSAWWPLKQWENSLPVSSPWVPGENQSQVLLHSSLWRNCRFYRHDNRQLYSKGVFERRVWMGVELLHSRAVVSKFSILIRRRRNLTQAILWSKIKAMFSHYAG